MKHSYLKKTHASRPFTSKDYRTIYNYPTPSLSSELVIGVISFGGGIHGTIDSNGYLTSGDIHRYLNDLHLPIPKIIIKPIFDGALDSSDDNATIENTMDIEMIAGCCPSANLTIILYVASQNTSFHDAFNYMITVPVNDKLPTIISCSWGMPEIYVTDLYETNDVFETARLKGINICTATGDYGSSDGLGGGNYCDFPSSSPNVIACGGTTLISPNFKYDNATKEYSWNNGGGGISRYFQKSVYQLIQGTNRNTPDIAMNADPATGVSFLVDGSYITVGGTSIVAPAFAAYIACCQLNTTFIIPYIYKYPTTFHDIIRGNNGGYKALPGYDRTTGVGSLNGVLFYNMIMNGSIKTDNAVVVLNQPKIIQYDGNRTVIGFSLTNRNIRLVQRNGNTFRFVGIKTGPVTLTLILNNSNKLTYTFNVINQQNRVKQNRVVKTNHFKQLMTNVIR